MFRLTTDARVHDAFQTVVCCLCGRRWDEQFVGVMLLESEAALGSLCPHCLSQTPQTAAAQVSEYERSWRALFDQARRGTGEQPELQRLHERISAVAQQGAHLRSIAGALLAKGRALQEQALRLRQELNAKGAELRGTVEESRRRHERSDETPCGAPPASLPETTDVLAELSQRLGEAERLSIFSAELSRLARWPTTLRSAMELERGCFQRHFPLIGDYALQRMVDGRYEEFLASGNDDSGRA